MPRKTRAAAKAQDAILADVDDASGDIQQPPTPKRDREPLRSITPNSVDSLDNERTSAEAMTKAKVKKGKKGGAKKKSKKTKADPLDERAEIALEPPNDLSETVDASPDTHDAIDKAAAAVVTAIDHSQQPKAEEQTESSLGRSTRMTRRQQAKAEAEAEVEAEAQAEPHAALQAEPVAADPALIVDDGPVEEGLLEEAMVDEVLGVAPEPKAIAGELILSPPEPNGAEGTPALSPIPLQDLPDRTRPEPLTLVASNTTSRRTSQVEDPIEAIDALEDEIDEVAKIMPALDSPLSPVKSKTTKKTEKSKVVTPATSTTRPAGIRTNKLVTSTQPSATSRVRSLAEPKKPTTTLSHSSSIKARPKSLVVDAKPKESGKSQTSEVNKSVDYLAAKRRPISVSFPTPPPPPKSKKPTTVSNFTLPGEAVAAKLKAQRLERQKREEEEAARKREFKARPIPTIRAKPVEVKQTAASKARQSIMTSGEKEQSTGLKRSSTVTGATTTAANKRNSLIAAKRSSVIGVPKSTTISSTTSSTANGAQKRSSVVAISSRTATATASAKDRAPSSSSSSLSRSVSASDAVAQRLKGKEVYNRDNVEKAAREKAQKEKDDAVKRARAEAAERGRQASREWAEKQKRIVMEKKKAAPTSRREPDSTPGAARSTDSSSAAPVAV